MTGVADTVWMRPKKWGEFQHYHDGRSLTWIKNYIELDLPGSKFGQLSWADQGRLQALWRLAARLGKDGLIPYDERYLRAALGDKRFPIGGQMLPIWFHIGTEKELKAAAKREERSRRMGQKASLEVRGKSKRSTTRAVPVSRSAVATPEPVERPGESDDGKVRSMIAESLKAAA